MKSKNNENVAFERVCKKCGSPLISKSRYKHCDNCRREIAKARKKMVVQF